MNLKRLTKILFINTFIFAIIIFIGELLARSFHPGFKGDIYTENISKSINVHKGFVNEIQLSRIPYASYSFDNSKGMFLIIGDSVTYGFGTPYEEIYWVKLKSLYNLLDKDELEFLPFAQYGNNLSQEDLIDNILKISEDFKNQNKFILYQFNYNDIQPKNPSSLKAKKLTLGDNEMKVIMKKNSLYKLKYYIKKLTWTTFNKSTLYRVSTHYATSIKRIPLDYQTCEEKGLNSLGQYTWTFASKGFEKESEISWNIFENKLNDLKKVSDEINAELYMFITPTIFDIDKKNAHPYFNSYRLDLSCATINPNLKLKKIAKKLNIKLIDPSNYIKDKFESTLKEGNFIPFYFPADTNHLSPSGQTHLGNYLFKEMFLKSDI